MKVGSNVGTLKLGSTAVAAIKRGTDRVYDADVAAFQKASDAADVTGIMDLVDYLKGQSLWDYARFYPMKSSQNAGSGSTVYGLGGLTSNNMTLVNSPTWGSDGVAFDAASSQYGNVGDIFDGGDLTVFARVAYASDSPTANEDILGLYDGAQDERSFIFRRAGGNPGNPFQLLRASQGTFSFQTIEVNNTTDHTVTSAEECLIGQFLGSNSRSVWQGKQQLTLALQSGYSLQSSTHNSDLDAYFAANNSGTAANFADLRGACLLVLSGVSSAPTTTQRETITDLINAL